MAINITLVEAIHNSADASSYAFASHTFTAGNLYIAFIITSHASLQAPAVLTLNGTTAVFTNITSVIFSGASNNLRNLEAWRFLPAANVTEVVTATLTGNTPATSGDLILLEITGHDISGINGSGAIVQNSTVSGTTGDTTGSVTLNAFGNSNNRPLGCIVHVTAETSTVGSGFSSLDDGNHTAPSLGALTEWHATSANNTINATWTTNGKFGIIGLEIKNASSSSIPKMLGLLGVG